jgi:hypothetical protein
MPELSFVSQATSVFHGTSPSATNIYSPSLIHDDGSFPPKVIGNKPFSRENDHPEIVHTNVDSYGGVARGIDQNPSLTSFPLVCSSPTSSSPSSSSTFLNPSQTSTPSQSLIHFSQSPQQIITASNPHTQVMSNPPSQQPVFFNSNFGGNPNSYVINPSGVEIQSPSQQTSFKKPQVMAAPVLPRKKVDDPFLEMSHSFLCQFENDAKKKN